MWCASKISCKERRYREKKGKGEERRSKKEGRTQRKRSRVRSGGPVEGTNNQAPQPSSAALTTQHHPCVRDGHATTRWDTVCTISLALGMSVSKRRPPERCCALKKNSSTQSLTMGATAAAATSRSQQRSADATPALHSTTTKLQSGGRHLAS